MIYIFTAMNSTLHLCFDILKPDKIKRLQIKFTRQICIFLSFLLSITFCNFLSAAEPNTKPVYKTAIYIENRAGNEFNDKVTVFEDFITNYVTKKGFRVISREVSIDSLKSYNKDLKTDETLDQLLSNNTSALRLAQMMGADYIMVASITSLGTEKKLYKGYGIETKNLIHTLRASYKIIEGIQGGTLAGETVKVSRSVRYREGSQSENTDMINELLDEAAVLIAKSLSKKQIPQPPPKPEFVEIDISCGMQDLAQLPVSVPDIRVTEDGGITVEKENLEIQVLDVTVELNGTVIGSAPGTFKVPPSLSKIRLSREGFNDWERTINIINEQNPLKVALQMSDTGYKRWKDNTEFLQEMKNSEKLTDAEVEYIKGLSQMFRQSGFKVDIKADIKGKAKSIFDLFDLGVF